MEVLLIVLAVVVVLAVVAVLAIRRSRRGGVLVTRAGAASGDAQLRRGGHGTARP